MRAKQRHSGPGGIVLVLDASEIYPEDPGNGTPAMVYLCRGLREDDCSSTYWCCQGEGEVEHLQLTRAQTEWIDKIEPVVDAFYAAFPDGVHS